MCDNLTEIGVRFIFLFPLGRNTEKPPSELQRGKNLVLTPCLECAEACSVTIHADTHLAKWLREEQGLSQIHKRAQSKPSSSSESCLVASGLCSPIWVPRSSFNAQVKTHTDPHTCTLASRVWETENPPCPVHPLWAVPLERSREDLLWSLSSS